MRGTRDERRAGCDPERALCAAIILQALADARRGDNLAAAWLDDQAGALLEMLDMWPGLVAGWQAAVAVYPGRIRGVCWQPPKKGRRSKGSDHDKKAARAA